jgi:NitT/TauT family transport system permease protein
MNKKQTERWAPVVLAIVVLLIWQLVCTVFQIPEFLFPSPIAIGQSMAEFAAPLAEAGWKTFWVTMVGFGLSILVGVLLGFLVGSSRLAYAAVYPLLVAFNAVPKAAIVPILIVWFGIGIGPGILTAVLISFFPITVHCHGSPRWAELECCAYGRKHWDVLVKVGLPVHCHISLRHSRSPSHWPS